MARYDLNTLKAKAFTLSKLLATHRVKVSSQQCLDVLSRLEFNRPYEALAAEAGGGGERRAAEAASDDDLPVAFWLLCGARFGVQLAGLNRAAVDAIAWPRESPLPNDLRHDANTYLRAVGAVSGAFSLVAERLVKRLPNEPHFGDLKFSVEPGNPVVDGTVAVMRVKHVKGKGRSFEAVSCDQQSEPLLFGAEARVALVDNDVGPPANAPAPYTFRPALALTFEVVGQSALKAYARILTELKLQDVWSAAPMMKVQTRILLTSDDGQESLEDEWTTHLRRQRGYPSSAKRRVDCQMKRHPIGRRSSRYGGASPSMTTSQTSSRSSR
jgi:hypothetical protein